MVYFPVVVFFTLFCYLWARNVHDLSLLTIARTGIGAV